METAIQEMAQGAVNGLSMYTSWGVEPFFKYLYGVIALASLFIILREFRGTKDVQAAAAHSLGLIFIWLLFGYPLDPENSMVEVKYVRADRETEPTSVAGIPAGLRYSMALIDRTAGWAMDATKGLSRDIDFTKMPFAVEKHTVKMHGALEDLAVKREELAPDIDYYRKYCADQSKIDKGEPAFNYDYFRRGYIADNAPSDCGAKSDKLVKAISDANRESAKAQGLDENTVGKVDSRGFWAKAMGNAFFESMKAVLLSVLSLVTLFTAYVYSQVFPYFLGIMTNLYFVIYPIILARAMFPGQWTVIITYLEGYLWLMFIPVVISAVDGFTAASLINFKAWNLPATLTMLAKISIVMAAPAIASFLLFGQRPGTIGVGGVSGRIAGAAVVAATAVAGRAASAAGKAINAANVRGSEVRPAGGGGSSGDVARVMSGQSAGSIVSAPNRFWGSSKGISPRANLERAGQNGAGLDQARAHVSGVSDSTGAPPVYATRAEARGMISQSGFSDGLKDAEPLLSSKEGATLLVKDPGTETEHMITAKKREDGTVQYSPAEKSPAAAVLAGKMNGMKAGGSFPARLPLQAQKIEFSKAGAITVSDIAYGHVSNTRALQGEAARQWLDSQKIA